MNERKIPKKGQIGGIQDGLYFDGDVFWATCPECGNEQGDMGRNICCEECDHLMPTAEALGYDV